MENSVVNTIEKIKLQELDMESKLIEKRKFEGTIANLQKEIRDSMTHNERLAKEEAELNSKTSQLTARLEIAKIHRDALTRQLQDSSLELEGLKAEADKGIAHVWSIRSSLAEAVHDAVDSCDIRALLMKPKPLDLVTQKFQAPEAPPAPLHEDRLKAALAKRDAIRAKRDKLLSEPDSGEEFLRIKNALRYSMEMTNSLTAKSEGSGYSTNRN